MSKKFGIANLFPKCGRNIINSIVNQKELLKIFSMKKIDKYFLFQT